jgi:hypothetical protein
MAHPSQGNTQLFRRDLNYAEYSAVLDNPRAHTGLLVCGHPRVCGSTGGAVASNGQEAKPRSSPLLGSNLRSAALASRRMRRWSG